MFIGTAGQGEFSDRFGRKIHLSVQPAAVRHVHDPRRVCPDASRCWSSAASSPASASAPSSRLPSPMPANIRPSAFAAASWRSCISSAAPACGRSERRCSRFGSFREPDRLARRVDRDRHRRADRLGVPLRAAGIAALSGDPRPRQGGARRARAAGHCRTEGAAHDRRREQHQERSVRRRLHACSRCASSPA